MTIRWYSESDLLSETDGSSGHAMIDIISTDHHEAEYKCKAVSSMESQEAEFTISVEGKRMSSNLLYCDR